MKPQLSWRQRGVALPVVLIILTVLLIGSSYLLRSSNSATMMASNLSYQSTLSKAADLGLMTGFQWLSSTAINNKQALNLSSGASGYVANFDTTSGPNDPDFWTGSATVTDGANSIEYVVHRMCSLTGAFDAIGPPANRCMQTAANTSTMNNSVAAGTSLATDTQQLASSPQLHYVITSRIFGPHGGNVVNQMVVLIGA